MDIIEDVVKELGHLALGTRLKRLGERLQAQTQFVLERAGIDVPASHFPLLAALDRLGALNVGELSDAVGMSQPGVTRLLDKLALEGLIQSTQSVADRRVRTIALTRLGRQLVSKAKRSVWPVVEAAVADACAGPARALLPALAALEEALEKSPLHARAEALEAGENKHAAT
jgi:DNA-binding MarR family transcriptional regulator